MSSDLNRCEFIGRLGADPETRYTSSGAAVTQFRLACGWKSKEREGTEWITVVAWNRLGEICAQYLHKGSRVYIAGRFTTRKWQAQDGSDRYKSEIVADHMQMLDTKPADGTPRTAPAQGADAKPDFDDDIPF